MFFFTRWMLCLLLTLPGVAAATAQLPDFIEMDGRKMTLNIHPLRPLLRERGWIPPADASITQLNARGYTAQWRLEDDQLVLVDASIMLKGSHLDKTLQWRSIKGELFPGQERVVAHWYDGVLVNPRGETTGHPHLGHISLYDRYEIMRLQHGRVVERLVLRGPDFEVYRSNPFEVFRQSPEFHSAVAETMRTGTQEAEAIDALQRFHAEMRKRQ